MEKEYKEAYKIDNENQLDKALKCLDALGYKWNSGAGLTEWNPNMCDDDFPIVLSVGMFGKPNTVTYGALAGSGIDYKPPFDNLLDAPDYSEGELHEENETTDLKDSEPSENKVTKYTVRLISGENIYVEGYKGVYNSDFITGRGDTNKLTAKQLFMYLTGERVEPDSITNGKADIREGLDIIETIEVDGTHKEGEFESDVRFTVIADGKNVTIDRFLTLDNDYHLFENPDVYDGNELTFDELLAFITGRGDVDHCDSFKDIHSISIVTPDKEDEETSDTTYDAADKTRFVIRLTNRRVVWRVPNDVYMDIAGPMNGFELKSKEDYSINQYWDYHLTVEELAEALSLINLSELASISIVD